MTNRDLPYLSADAVSGRRFAVRVTPRARVPGIVWGDPIQIKVSAAPSDGKATEEARTLLARALNVAPSRLHLRQGATSRLKLFELL